MAAHIAVKYGLIIKLLILLFVCTAILYFITRKDRVPVLVNTLNRRRNVLDYSASSNSNSHQHSDTERQPSVPGKHAARDNIMHDLTFPAAVGNISSALEKQHPKASDAVVSYLISGLVFRPYKDVVITDDMSVAQAQEALLHYIETRHLDCTDGAYIGRLDAGWPVCNVSSYRLHNSCLVYALGTNSKFYQTEKDMADAFGCTVRVFDPRITANDIIGCIWRPPGSGPVSHLVNLYQQAPKNLSDANDNYVPRTMATLLDEYNETSTVVDYLSVHVEQDEWSVIEGMMNDNSLSHVKQLAITVHMSKLTETTSVKVYKKYWRILNKLECLGYKKWYYGPLFDGTRRRSIRARLNRACCHQLVFVNTHFASDNHYTLPELDIPAVPSDTPKKLNTLAVFESSKQSVIPGADNLAAVRSDMSLTEAEEAFYRFLITNTAECPTHQRVGNTDDGGWNMCTTGDYLPTHDTCLVYSFGINYDWSFDEAISEAFDCTVKAFDPSMPVGDHKHSEKIWFYQTGISGENTINDQGWKLRTFGTLLQELGDSKDIIDYLKIDVEYSEWEAFTAIFEEKSLTNVKQMGFEIHTHELNGGTPTTVEQYVFYYNLLKKLEDLGFRKWLNHNNPLCTYNSPHTGRYRTCCHELYYINTRYLTRT